MQRLTIRRLMIVTGGLALILVPLRSVDRTNRPLALQVGALLGGVVGFGVACRLGWSRPRWARASCLGAGCLWSSATAPILAYLLSIGGIMLLILTTLLLGPIVLGAGIAWTFGPAVTYPRQPRPRRWRRGGVVVALLALPISMMVTQWPLHLAFTLSRPALDRLADRIARGGSLHGPERAGCYRIVATQVSPMTGNIALIIDADPAGRSAFTRVRRLDQTYQPLFNFNFDMPMGGRWQYQNED